jgi:hypothetical protein
MKSKFYQNLMKNELHLNQSFILSIILLISPLNFEGLWLVIVMLVSSANKIGFDGSAIISGRSFI